MVKVTLEIKLTYRQIAKAVKAIVLLLMLSV